MSETQLNSIEISQQPENGQETSMNENNQIGMETTSREEEVAEEMKTHQEELEMNKSHIDFEKNYEPLETYHDEMNHKKEEDKRIILENEEGEMSNNPYYEDHYTNEDKNHPEKEENGFQGPVNENFDRNINQIGITEEIEVKIMDDGYNYEPQIQYENQESENHHNFPLVGEQRFNEHENYSMNGNVNEMNNENYLTEYAENNGENFNGNNHEQSNEQIQLENASQQIMSEQKNYNSYVQAILNNPINPASEPSHEALEEIYNELKKKFPECMPEQIILLLYNNLIKIPREEMIEEEGEKFDESLKYDCGRKYFLEVSTSTNRADMFNYELRKQMVKIYVTKGYGLKVYQEQMLAINPNAQPIDKEKFKSHFVNIYKTVIKKVEEFLSITADRQFEPITRKEFHMTLGDVINCRKHYSTEFCEVFFKLIQSTFDPNFDQDQLPNEGEVIFFYRTILGKVREQKIILPKKMHLPEEEKDTDIWTEEFEYHFIKLFIIEKNIFQAKIKLIQEYPECECLLTEEKLKEKIENAIRVATRWLQIENENCGNQVSFNPSDIGKRFIMRAPELEQSRIKLLKVYVKKPKDPQVLSDIVNFINKELRSKYDQEKIPEEALQRSTINQVPRTEEKAQLEKIIKAQIMRNP